jgi:hypothetical protein
MLQQMCHTGKLFLEKKAGMPYHAHTGKQGRTTVCDQLTG